MPGRFIDTNILVYVASSEAGKADRAEAVIASGGSISVQVLNELANVGRRKMRLDWPELRRFVSLFRALLTVHPVTIETHDVGMRLAARYGFSIYDAMIAGSAVLAGCDTLLSEDMQHGMVLEEGLQVVNPFL